MDMHEGIAQRLAKQRVLVLDGALATELEARGCCIDDALWSAKILLEDPAQIEAVHYDYFAAGAQIGTSASYQATLEGFERRGLSRHDAAALIALSVELVRRAAQRYWREVGAASGQPMPLVAASVGPYGAYLADGSEYRGDYAIGESELVAFHLPRMRILSQAGADLFACETIPCLCEARAMVRAIAQMGGFPCWISFSCQNGTQISDGTPIAQCAEALDGVDFIQAIGVNCTAPEHIGSLIRILKAHTQKPIVVYGNSGEVYDPVQKRWLGSPSGRSYADWAREWIELGAQLVGGCCRTTPADIAQIRRMV